MKNQSISGVYDGRFARSHEMWTYRLPRLSVQKDAPHILVLMWSEFILHHDFSADNFMMKIGGSTVN